MKKLFLALVLLLLPLGVKASEYYIAIDNGQEIIYEEYEVVFKDWLYYFKPSPFGIYEINDIHYVNNVANAFIYYSLGDYFATIQMMIYQNTHPNYHIFLTDESFNYLDNSKTVNYILNQISVFDVNPEFAGKTYYLNTSEELTLEHPYLSRYVLDDYEIIDDKVTFSFSEAGEYIIEFKNKPLNIVDNYFTTEGFQYKPFSIKIIVDDYYDLAIKTYINDVLVPNNISINNNIYKEEEIRLSAGSYNIIDNYTNKTYSYNLEEDSYLTINNYFVNRLETNINIDKICNNDNYYEFTKNDNIYEFSDSLPIGIYKIYTDNLEYVVDFSDESNYDINEGILTFNFYQEINNPPTEEKPEDLEDVQKPDDSETQIPIDDTPVVEPPKIDANDQGNVVIDIPDTNIAFKDNFIYYVEKKYYIFRNYFNNNLYSSI